MISWVADHRKHHAFSDQEGDPHSPHVDHGGGWAGALRGLAHAHVGWLFIHTHRGARDRYAPDLVADPVVRFVDRTFVIRALGGLAAAFGLGYAIGGTLDAALTGLLWGGGVRMLFLHHVTYSINRCAIFGSRRFPTDDESRNWHGWRPCRSARHGTTTITPSLPPPRMVRRWEVDPSAAFIRVLERLGLAWDVVRVPPAAGRQARRKRCSMSTAPPRRPCARPWPRHSPSARSRSSSGTGPPCPPPTGPVPRSGSPHPPPSGTCCGRRANSALVARTSREASRSMTSMRRWSCWTTGSRLDRHARAGCDWPPLRFAPEPCARCHA